jgi:hypothetical protein
VVLIAGSMLADAEQQKNLIALRDPLPASLS